MHRPSSAERTLTAADVVEQSQWDFFWVPKDVQVVDRPELLYLCCPRDVPLLNTVTRTRARGALEPLVEEVCVAHAHVTSRWLVRDRPDDERLARVLASAGYGLAFEHGAYVRPVGPPRRTPDRTGIEVRQVSDLPALLDWYTVADQVFEQPTAHPAHELETFLAECTRPGARVHRFVGYHDGQPVSSGGMTSFAELRFGYLWAGATLARARGRGCYRSVLEARIDHAAALGLERVGLYARVESSAPIVARLGFERHGTMCYWDRRAR